jgi:hypothetical protein
LACDHCEKPFKVRYWLARHLSRVHHIDIDASGSPDEASEQPQPSATPRPAPEPVNTALHAPRPEPCPWVVVVADLAGTAPAAHAAVFSTDSDAAQAAALLRKVGQHARSFALEAPETP